MLKSAIVYTESRHVPVAIERYVYWRDGGECVTPGCDCRDSLELDHVPCWNTMPEGQRYHDPDKIFLRCKPHHKTKSNRDTSESAKSKRVGKKHRGEQAPTKCLIKSRPFAKGPKQKIQSKSFEKRTRRGWP